MNGTDIKIYQKVLASIPSHPGSITTPEIKDILVNNELISAKTCANSQMKTVQRVLKVILAEHTEIVEQDDKKPYVYYFEKGVKQSTLFAMSSVLPLKILEDEITQLLPCTLRKETDLILHSLSDEGNRRVKLWIDRFCYIPSDFQLQAKEVPEDIFSEIEKALLEKRDLILEYKSRDSEVYKSYEVTPLGVFLKGSRFYLEAEKLETGTIQSFALLRIQSLKQSHTSINLPESFNLKKHIKDNKNYFGGGDLETVTLKINNDEAKQMLNETLIGSNQKILEESDEWTVIQTDVSTGRMFESWLLKYSYFIEVLSPASLRNKITYRLQQASKMYLNNSSN